MLSLSLLAGCGSKTAAIDLTDYMNALFRGEDGEGSARADFDFSGFENAAAAQSGGSGDGILQKLVRFESTLDITVTPDRGLKNGDKVTLTAVYDKDAAKAAGIAIGKTEKTVTVEGLGSPSGTAAPATQAPAAPTSAPAGQGGEEGPASSGNLTPQTEEPREEAGKELDAFDPEYWNKPEGIEVRYTGSSPYGWLEAVCHLPESSPFSRISYRFSPQENVHEGDKVTVTAVLTGENAEGYALKRTETEFTLGPVDHFLLNPEELDGTALSALKQAMRDLADAYAAGTVEFRSEEGWKGFYNGETITINSFEVGETVYAARYSAGFIQALMFPCYLQITAEDPDWREDPQTRVFDLVLLCTVDGIVVDKNGAVDFNRPELAAEGVPALEEELAEERLGWYDGCTLETAVLQLPG